MAPMQDELSCEYIRVFVEKGPGQVPHGQKELTDLIHKYVKQLVALPDHIIQCNHMTKFLQNRPREKEVGSPLTVKGIVSE